VDEADSIFVDEARTPLILSREANSDAESTLYRQAVELARGMEPGLHYQLDSAERRIDLTPKGDERLSALAKTLGGAWLSRAQREDLCGQALTALHLMNRDEHYIIRDGKVQIVDEYTGRVMADRFWSEGLHQMVEVKEDCTVSGKRVTLARMTYQRFFRRYRVLSGMTGTGQEVAGEMWRVYRLAVARIPTHKPPRRIVFTDFVARTAADKWRIIAERCRILKARGIPVLVGTRSVAASNALSAELAARDIEHVILNAAQDAAEAEIVAKAGEPGQITVATNIAGRGTDIEIVDSVAKAGGLHVIMSERHEARRIDRQLEGRCARQGQPGVFRAILSLEDPLFAESGLPVTTLIARLGGQRIRRWASRRAQRKAEQLHARMRRDLLRNDESLDHALAISGKAE
jgi:preprotein translocase subunit SecA